MGKSAGSNVSTSSSSYPAWQQPAVQNFVNESTRLYNQGGPQLNPESRVANFNQDELAAQRSLGAAVTPTTQLAQQGSDTAAFNLGPGRDPATNPYLQNAISAAVAPISDQLLTRALPAIRHNSIASGGYGGSKMGIGEAQAVRDASRVAGEVSSGLANQGYQSGQANATATLGMLPQLQQNWAFPASLQSAVGSQVRGLEEAQLNENADRYEYYQRLPYENLLNYGNQIRSPFGAEATSQVTVPQPSTASSIVGGALSIPALLQMLQGLFNPANARTPSTLPSTTAGGH